MAPSAHLSPWILVLVAFSVLAVRALHAEEKQEEPKGLKEALSKGKASVFVRYRYERVKDEAVGEKRAHASTLRTELSYETRPFKRLHFYLEAENVTVVGDDEAFNNRGAGEKNNGVTDRPVVADPELTAITGAYLGTEFLDTLLRLGRQEIDHRDQRFIGSLGWRQHHQTFDAINARNASVRETNISYSFLGQVNRIFGDSQDLTGHLLLAETRIGNAGTLALYGYLLDYDEPGEQTSQQTYGGEFVGARASTTGSSYSTKSSSRRNETLETTPTASTPIMHTSEAVLVMEILLCASHVSSSAAHRGRVRSTHRLRRPTLSTAGPISS